METEGTMYEGELVDTREGFTYRDVTYVLEDGVYTFYERFYGYRADDFNNGDGEYDNKIEDEYEILSLMNSLKE